MPRPCQLPGASEPEETGRFECTLYTLYTLYTTGDHGVINHERRSGVLRQRGRRGPGRRRRAGWAQCRRQSGHAGDVRDDGGDQGRGNEDESEYIRGDEQGFAPTKIGEIDRDKDRATGRLRG
jgi:hypothetical protein